MAGAWISPFEDGAPLIDEALSLAERVGDKRLVGYAHLNRALHRFAFGLQREVLEAGQEGTRLLRAEGDLWEVATLLGFMECAAVELGQMGLAAEFGGEAHVLATRLGHTFSLFVLNEMARSARLLAATPDLAKLEASAQRHLEVAGPMGFRHMSGTLLSHVAFLRGDWGEAARWATDAVQHSPEGHSTSGMDWGCYLRVLAYCGRATDVLTVLDGRQDAMPRPGRPNGYGPWYLPAAAIEALCVIGERDCAAGFYPLVREYIDSTGVVLSCFTPLLFQRIAGIGAAAGGHWDIAEEHFRMALRQAQDIPLELEAAETRRWYAWMVLDRDGPGDRDHAIALLDAALPVYRRIGMLRHEELALAARPG